MTRLTLGHTLLLFDLGYRVGELVQIRAKCVQKADDRAPARIAPPTLNVRHVRLAGAHKFGEHLLSEARPIPEHTNSPSEGVRVVVGARSHQRETCDIRCVALRSAEPNIVPPRCGNSRGRGPVGISYGARATLPDRRRCTNAAKHLRCLQRQEEPTMSSTKAMPDLLVVAAIERAERHSTTGRVGIPVWAILEHLDLPRRSALARHVRTRLTELESTGVLTQTRRHSVPVWTLTPTGRGRLKRARRAGTLLELPESPQHRAWRAARTLAEHEIERFHAAVETDAEALGEFLDLKDTTTLSDVWLAMGERLYKSLRRLGSATYCLKEWAEPDDAHADIDDGTSPADSVLDSAARRRAIARRAGRRNARLWDEELAAVERD